MINLLVLILAVLIMFIQNHENRLICASTMATENKWHIVNDGVMGGLSSSKAIVNNDSKIVFSGNVSLENNGGFASLRSPVKDYNFEKFSGIEIKIKGDGKRYSVSMKETTYFNGYFYTCSFETKKDEWIVIQIPFDQFKLYYFGKGTDSIKKLPLNKIKEISLLIGDKQQGEFKAEIDYMMLY